MVFGEAPRISQTRNLDDLVDAKLQRFGSPRRELEATFKTLDEDQSGQAPWQTPGLQIH